MTGLDTPSILDGSMSAGIETPSSTIDLRKRSADDSSGTDSEAPRELYRIIQERTTQVGGTAQLFGSDRLYVVPGKTLTGESLSMGGGADVALNPDDPAAGLKDKEQLREAYDAQQQGEGGEGEDDKGKRKRRVDGGAGAKRYKDFKF